MKRILVPTDFSDQAHHALEVALAIARYTGGSLKLLHVVEAPYPVADFSTTGDVLAPQQHDHVFTLNLLELAKEKMQGLMQLARQAGVEVIDEVAVDNIHGSIIRLIKKDQVDLVVMGSKGSSGIEEFLIGSNTEKVVREAACPVLTVKQKHSSFDVRNIVLASDFNRELGTAIEKFKFFQTLFKARLHLVFVNTPGSFETATNLKSQLETAAKRYGLENYTVNVYNDAVEEDGILNFAKDINADLIMMATHGRTGFSRLLSGSITEDLVNHANLPVLTVHLEDKD